MPGFDRTGPAGQGPMTGGRQGLCTGNNAPGAGRPFGFGRGGGRFRGGGRGFGFGRRGWYSESPGEGSTGGEQELRDEIGELRKQLKDLKQTIAGLQKPEK